MLYLSGYTRLTKTCSTCKSYKLTLSQAIQLFVESFIRIRYALFLLTIMKLLTLLCDIDNTRRCIDFSRPPRFNKIFVSVFTKHIVRVFEPIGKCEYPSLTRLEKSCNFYCCILSCFIVIKSNDHVFKVVKELQAFFDVSYCTLCSTLDGYDCPLTTK